MTSITIISKDGTNHQVEVHDGDNLMDVARSVTDEVEALCGGCCSCATCHVYIDSAFVDRIPAPTTAELELLECSDHQQPNSRLSCQVILNGELEGLSVVVAPED